MFKNGIINVMRNIILRYDSNNGLLDDDKPLFICENIDTRNRYKVDSYKIPEDEPQCPIYKDNRCCGGCKHASYCDHCVDCNCFGYTYAARGGTVESDYMRKCSNYYYYGRIKDGEFDWEYYRLNLLKSKIIKDKFFIFYHDHSYHICKIVSRKVIGNKIKILFVDSNYYKRISLEELYTHFKTYDTYDKANNTLKRIGGKTNGYVERKQSV